MYIDFHTHAFDEKIAAKAISRLEEVGDMKAYCDGTVSALTEYYHSHGIDKAVLLPIATKPTQQTTINNWSKSVESETIIPFGSVHPDAVDALEELERIKDMGMKGIKLHPDYQEFFVDEDRLFPIYKKCEELGLIIVFHAGFDPLSPKVIHALPEKFLKVYKKNPYLKMVLAHLGGMNCFSDVKNLLASLEGDLYFDTAFMFGSCPEKTMMEIINKHGTDRILFASDFPWHSPLQEIEMINGFDLSAKDKERIFWKNAVKLLNIKV